MLKFRSTNSMKARKAAEHQRKALEEQLKMEWAWKPMAAVMNDNKTDLVYWVPPLYASNILSSFTASSSSASSPASSLCSSPSLSRSRNLSRRSSLTPGTPMGSRKKRLSKRRVMSPKQSIEEVGEEVEPPTPTALTSGEAGAAYGASTYQGEDEKNDEKFDGTMKKDLVVEFEADEIEVIHTVPDINIDDEIEYHNKETLKMKDKKEERRKSKSEGKHRSIPAILKLLEKVSHIHDKPKARPITRRNAKIERTVSSGSQKIKRPSLKVYQNNPKHGSGRRATAPTIPTQPPATEAKEARMVITGKSNSGPRLSIRRSSRQSSGRARSASVTTTGLKVSQVTEAELRSAHLEMMIKILATLYEEKISRQDTEIKTLKDKFKSQDKIVKQIVHNMLEVKSEVTNIREHLMKQEESFRLHRSKLIIGQHSIPEEMEETEDLEMYEADAQDGDLSIAVPEMMPVSCQEHDSYICVGNDESNMCTPVISNVITVQGSSNLLQCVNEEGGEVVHEVCDVSKNDFLSDEFCRVLEPPDEFQSKDFEDVETTPEKSLDGTDVYFEKCSFAGDMYPGKKAVAGVDSVTLEQVELLASYRSNLDAQDGHEFGVTCSKLHDPMTGERVEHEETYFATQYVCDYHPREEMRIKQLREASFFEETLSNIDEDDRLSEGRCSNLSRQRSDESTNI
ncbi:uncharacterized protein LOC108666717 [Hyalella azteca]|uniref:Uncharacterized protein LOC108666717 n=1 Tax=Hyalella azteca TaxID=294128 RepID=A0A8B7N5G7_HYAAZ|nr:uncharacterized protein LOC108666717 [Hyalella azteca]